MHTGAIIGSLKNSNGLKITTVVALPIIDPLGGVVCGDC